MAPLAMTMSIHTSKVKVSYHVVQYLNVDDPHGLSGKFIPTRRTPGVSTSELLERIVSGYRKRDFDKKLEKMGHAELKAEGSDYDDRSSRATSRSISPMPSPRATSPGPNPALSPNHEGAVKP